MCNSKSVNATVATVSVSAVCAAGVAGQLEITVAGPFWPASSCSAQTDTPQANSMLYTIAVILLIAPEFQLILMSKPLSTRARSAIREAIRIRFTGES